MTLVLLVFLVALTFEFINGFHDTANAIATSVSTKVLTPRQAIVMAAFTNLLGALWGTAVAKTVAGGLVDATVITSEALVCALLGGIIWNLLTWWWGLPSSSSHALIGGLCGAALAAASGDWGVIIWSQPSSEHFWMGKGILWKVIVPMVLSPLIGFVVAVLVMIVLFSLFFKARPAITNVLFGKLQVLSAASMGFMHGTNDAQKTMGILALALVTATSAGTFDHLPDLLSFLRLHSPQGGGLEIPVWLKVLCALTMAAGTAAGGWKIIKTLGQKMVKLQPIQGFAAETSSACVLGIASSLGIPVSTTHNISSAILGAGAAKRFNAVKWSVVSRIMWAWVLTLPISGVCSYLILRLFQAFSR